MIKTTAVVTCMTDTDLPFVREAVQSVVNQTEQCKIVVIINENFSLSNPVISELQRFPQGHAASPSIFAIRRLPLQPGGVIRNIAGADADTDWIAFLDADDIWLPKKTAT